MPNTALITGASAGIGAEFARYHASQKGDLILVARRLDKLDALKAELEAAHEITVHTIAQDLGVDGGADALVAAVDALGLDVDILINNAGFGGHGRHIDRDLGDEQAMIDLNVKALVTLSHAFGGRMAAKGGGKILQVGSTAGMMPGPLQAVYFATKAFVQSFSQALDHELRDHGVTSTVLAPGYVETDFAERADLGGTDLVKSGKTPQSVAKHGYDAMVAGKLVTVNETQLGILTQWIIPFLPRRMVLNMIEKMQSK
ncbi:SDR family NAD(P)-dependent oxidoreductase [Octadecabacter sp. G9-8]|uniref:SDR family NAD(P)-dependent oxidoreductase n=1 Tax=Octadecabacter dasysiphoniae TaxID=2909341 RepID=A0ABS9CY56_9RHOB|nr:SDR family NAD(P)-dependent oxidoreductase [Octadecabacter dasysiphoniae]MCF2871764.1 SDR family NAD(P)-dependent oxidoreductase [Octadecabacter dasysiphoniae]